MASSRALVSTDTGGLAKVSIAQKPPARKRKGGFLMPVIQSDGKLKELPGPVEKFYRLVEKLLHPPLDEQFRRVVERLLTDEGDPVPSTAPAEGKARRKLGAHGSTLDRVKEARGLVEAGMPKTKACKRAKIDTRTYDRYVEEFVNWGDDEKS